MSVDILTLRAGIQTPAEVFVSCAEFAGLSLDLLRPSSVSCNTSHRKWMRSNLLTVTAQHTSILRQQGRNETPQQAFITDFCQFITDQHSQGNGVLLAGDYNKELDIPYNGITKLCSDFHLVNLMFHLTGQDDFATAGTSYAMPGSPMLHYKDAMNPFNIV